MITDGVLHARALPPPKGAQRRPWMAMLVIRSAEFHLIALLLQASHVVPVRLGLETRRRRAHLEGIRDKCKPLLQECADLRVACGNQCEIGVLLVSSHDNLLCDSEPWSLAIVDLPSSGSGVYKP